jgi:hypothetical protein
MADLLDPVEACGEAVALPHPAMNSNTAAAVTNRALERNLT